MELLGERSVEAELELVDEKREAAVGAVLPVRPLALQDFVCSSFLGGAGVAGGEGVLEEAREGAVADLEALRGMEAEGYRDAPDAPVPRILPNGVVRGIGRIVADAEDVDLTGAERRVQTVAGGFEFR